MNMGQEDGKRRREMKNFIYNKKDFELRVEFDRKPLKVPYYIN